MCHKPFKWSCSHWIKQRCKLNTYMVILSPSPSYRKRKKGLHLPLLVIQFRKLKSTLVFLLNYYGCRGSSAWESARLNASVLWGRSWRPSRRWFKPGPRHQTAQFLLILALLGSLTVLHMLRRKNVALCPLARAWKIWVQAFRRCVNAFKVG